jgi:hypothetical protein
VTGPDGEWVDVVPKPNTFVINMWVGLALACGDERLTLNSTAVATFLRGGAMTSLKAQSIAPSCPRFAQEKILPR